MKKEEFVHEYNNEDGLGKKLRERVRYFPSKKCTDSCEEFCTGGCPLFWTKFNPEEQITGRQ